MGFIQRVRRYWEYGNPFRKRIAYIGWIGRSNLGDEMLFEAHKRLFPSHRVLPFVASIGHAKRALYERVTGRNVFDGGCIGGGTLINKGNWNLATSHRLLEECPVCFCLGTGVASSEFWKGRGIGEDHLAPWVRLLRQFHFVGVRGPLSVSFLREAGLLNVEMVGDTALVLARESHSIPTEERLIGINIGTSLGNVWGTESELLARLSQTCKTLTEKGWKLVFLCVWPRDMESTVKLTRMAGIVHPEIHTITSSTKQALDFCERCSVFIGMKLHSVVTAICAGVPSIMIEYRPKCRGFYGFYRHGGIQCSL